jgi:hypothetical protein
VAGVTARKKAGAQNRPRQFLEAVPAAFGGLRPIREVPNKRDNKQRQEKVKDDLCNAGSSHGYPGKAQHGSNHCDYKESQSPAQHRNLRYLARTELAQLSPHCHGYLKFFLCVVVYRTDRNRFSIRMYGSV